MSVAFALSMNTEMIETQDAESAVGLRHYLDVLWRRKLTVVVIVALALGAAAIFTLRQQPQYRAQTTIVVGQAGGLVQPQNAGAIQPFSATMQELIRSTVVARRVIDALNLNESTETLLGQISIAFNPESAALNVSVVDRYPERAQAIAAQIGITFSALVKERFGQPAAASAATPPLTATVWDPAHVIPGKIKPTPKVNLAVAAVLGLVLGLLAAFVVDFFDRRLRTPEEIERILGVPVIGRVPSLDHGAKLRRMAWAENAHVVEAFRGLRANLQYLGVNRPLRTILVTSPVPDQGKTTVCASLATALAQQGTSVVVVEADLRRPRLGEAFQMPSLRSGLTTVLVGEANLASAVSEVSLDAAAVGSPHDGARVAVLPSGPLPPNPSELVGSPQMQLVLNELGATYERVIVDSPPMLIVADSLELAKNVDGVIVVVRLKRTTSDDVKELRALATRLGIHLVGAVVTDVPVRGMDGYTDYVARPQRSTLTPAAPSPFPAAPLQIPASKRRRASSPKS